MTLSESLVLEPVSKEESVGGLFSEHLRRPKWLKLAFTYIVLLAGESVVYARAKQVGFVQDDFPRLVRVRLYGFHGIWAELVHPQRGFYRPLVDAWFFVLTALWPDRVHPFHVGAALILAASGVGVILIAAEFGVTYLRALVAATLYVWSGALFTVVAWPSAISSALVALFVVILLGSSLKTGWASRILGIAALSGALLSKEAAVVAPLLASVLCLTKELQLHGISKRAWHQALLTVLRRTSALWLVLAFYGAGRLIVGSSPATSAYRLGLSSQTAKNAIHLSALSLGFSSGASSRHPLVVAVVALITWLMILVASFVGLRRHSYLGFGGLVIYGVGCLPVVFLSSHSVDDYYADLCGLGLALAVAGCSALWAPVSDRLAGWLLAGVAAAGIMAVMSWSARAELPASAVVYQGQRGALLLSEIVHDLPPGQHVRTIVLKQVIPADQWALGFGDAVRVQLDDVHLNVIFDPAVVPNANSQPQGTTSYFYEYNGNLFLEQRTSSS